MRRDLAAVLAAGAAIALAACGGGNGGGADTPEGFTAEEVEGVAYAVPSQWPEHPVEPTPDNWAVQYSVPQEELFVATFGVFTGLPDDQGDVSTNALMFLDTFRNEQGGFDSLSHDNAYEVPGAERAHRADYTFPIIEDDGTQRLAHGADLTVQAPDGTRTALRITVLDGEVEDGLIDQVLGTVTLP